MGPPATCRNCLLKTDIYLQIFIKDGFCNSPISSDIRGRLIL
jgi:hypothetical protein